MSNKFFLAFFRYIFARPQLAAFNWHIYKLSLRSLGMLNADTEEATGEPWLLKKLSKNFSPKVIIDVGANTDAYGFSYFPKAKIYCLEPHPKTYRLAQQKFQSLQNQTNRIKIFNFAASDSMGKTKLWDFADDAKLKSEQPTSQLASLHREVVRELHGQKAQSYTVNKITLDDFARRNKLTYIDILKIDAEGHELQVIRGAKHLLQQKRIGLIQFEFNEMNILTGAKMKDFYELLENYDFFRLLPSGLLPLGRYRPLTHEIFGFQNILAVPRGFVI